MLLPRNQQTSFEDSLQLLCEKKKMNYVAGGSADTES